MGLPAGRGDLALVSTSSTTAGLRSRFLKTSTSCEVQGLQSPWLCQSAVNLLGHWAEQLGYLGGRGIVNGMVRKLSLVQEWDTSPSSWFRETMTETGRELEGEIPGKGNAKVVSGHQKYSAITSRDMDWGSTKLIAFYTGIKLELIHIDRSYAACHFINYSISFFLSLFIFPVKMSASTYIFKGLAWHPYWVWCVAWVW